MYNCVLVYECIAIGIRTSTRGISLWVYKYTILPSTRRLRCVGKFFKCDFPVYKYNMILLWSLQIFHKNEKIKKKTRLRFDVFIRLAIWFAFLQLDLADFFFFCTFKIKLIYLLCYTTYRDLIYCSLNVFLWSSYLHKDFSIRFIAFLCSHFNHRPALTNKIVKQTKIQNINIHIIFI